MCKVRKLRFNTVLDDPRLHSSPLQINDESLVKRDQILKSVAGGEQWFHLCSQEKK
jgi:hypothetical protein